MEIPNLRQKATARRGRLVLSQAGCEFHLASLRPIAQRVPFVVRQQALRQLQRRQSRGQRVGRIEPQADRIVQRGPGHVEIRCAPDLLLANAGQVNADREHIDIRGHSRGPHRLRALEVGRRRTHGLAGRSELLRVQQRVVIAPNRARHRFHSDAPPVLSSEVFRQLGRAHRVLRLACVVERLIRRDLRLEIIEEIGPVQRSNLVVLLPELVLRQQGREYKYRIVATGPRLGVIDFWQIAAPCLRDAAFRGLLGCGGGCDRLILFQR